MCANDWQEARLTYQTPNTLESALDLVAQPEMQVIAGGTDFYPSTDFQGRQVHLVDITRIDELRGITHSENGFRIGGATTWCEVITADLPPAFHGLKAAAREVGSIQIQNAGTVAGNICNASPAADGIPPLLTLDAEVELASADRGIRSLSLEGFVQGVRQTDRKSDELVTAIFIPEPPAQATSAFEKLGSRKYLVISIAMTAVVVLLDETGAIADARIAVGACSPVAQRLRGLERRLIGIRPEDVSISADGLSPLSPIDDVRGTAEYRSDVVKEQCLRALIAAVAHG